MEIVKQYIVKDGRDFMMLSVTVDNRYFKHYGGFGAGDPGCWWDIKEIQKEEFESLLNGGE